MQVPGALSAGDKTATDIPEQEAVRDRTGILWILTGVVVLAGICCPVLALPASGGPGGAAQFLQGVPVFWPYHAGLMITGFVLLFSGMVIAHFHMTGNWYRSHAILQTCGAACIVAGMTVGAYMVWLSGLPALKNSHEILGVVTGSLVIVTLLLGYSIRRVHRKKPVRAGHRWMGRLVIVLMALTMVLGLIVLSLLLGL